MSKRAREGVSSYIDEPLAKEVKIDEGIAEVLEEVSLDVQDGSPEVKVIQSDVSINESPSVAIAAAADNLALTSFIADLLFGKIGKGWHPLDFATWVKNQAAQEYFINQGYCTIEARSRLSIHNAVIYGDIERIKDFLRSDPDSIESVSVYGYTPLTAAITVGNKDTVNFLLDNGANIEAVAAEGELTPLATAIDCNDIDMVALLLDKGADINGCIIGTPSEGCTPLIMALGFRYVNYGKSDVAINANIHGAEPNIEIAKLLIKRGADLETGVDEHNNYFCCHTAVSQASCRNLPEMLEILFENGFSNLPFNDNFNMVDFTYFHKAYDSLRWFMNQLQKPADQYDENTMDLAGIVINACISFDLPMSFLYELLSHDTDDGLILRNFEESNDPWLFYALDRKYPDDGSKDKMMDLMLLALKINGTNDISLNITYMQTVTTLLDFLQTSVVYTPSCSIAVGEIDDLSITISSREWYNPNGESDKVYDPIPQINKRIKQQTDRIKVFLKFIDFVLPLDFPPITRENSDNIKPKCYEQIIDDVNSKIQKTIEDNIKNGQWLYSYFNDMKFTDASGNNMRDPGLIICEYLGASAQKIMEIKKPNTLPSPAESANEWGAAACSSSYEASFTGVAEDINIDG